MANSLALLLKGGVDTVTALKTVANSLENTVYQDLMKEAAQAVEDGNYLANSLANNPVIPYMVVAMVRVGERAGHLDNALEKINDFYSYQVERSVSNLVNVIEPVVIVLMGLGVGVVVAAMILPMYQVVGGV